MTLTGDSSKMIKQKSKVYYFQNDFFCKIRKHKEAMIVENGKITFLGSTSEALEKKNDRVSRVFNLTGNVVLPGLHDVHVHPLEAGSEIAGTCKLHSNTR